MVKEYEERRNILFEGLKGIDGVKCVLPEGTFYAFPNISGFGKTSWGVAKYLLNEYRVATIPGSIFGKRGEGYLRISFASNVTILKEAVSRIKEGLNSLQKNKLRKNRDEIFDAQVAAREVLF